MQLEQEETSKVIIIKQRTNNSQTVKYWPQKRQFDPEKPLKPMQCYSWKSKVLKLKKTIKEQNIKALIYSFARKLSSQSMNAKIDLRLKEEIEGAKVYEEERLFFNFRGFKIRKIYLAIWALINMLHSILMVLLFFTMMAFHQTSQNYLPYLQIGSLGILLVDSFISMTVEKYDDKGKVILGGENVLFYITNYLLVDYLNIIMLFLSVVVDADFNSIKRQTQIYHGWVQLSSLFYLLEPVSQQI